jgi:hypothetical protein
MCGIIFFIAGFNGQSVDAKSLTQADCPIDYVWKQKISGDFVVLYTASHVVLAEEISEKYVRQFGDEFAKYEIAFSTTISTPITIRIYPSELEYYCLNALAPLISSEDTHSHIGTREIALIAKVINRSPMTWDSQAMNAIRHEIAVLFGEKITNGKAPPGLLQGLGGYFEDPADTFSNRLRAAGNISQPDRGWQRLWEEDIPVSNALVFLQQTSTVGYLIDVFGWEKFVSFLQAIAEYQGYRQALVEVYEVNLQDLQTHWGQYFPVYINARWQANVIHSFDLSQFSQLISEGAYADAAERLEGGIPLIELFGSVEQLNEANALLSKAEMGIKAANLAYESRQAILALDDGLGYTSAEQALILYRNLDDPRRFAEVETYRDICAEVLTLREELDRLRGFGTPLDPVRTQRIISIGRRLNELGDSEGANQVQIALLLLGAGQQIFVQGVTIVGLLLCVYLIWRRIVFVRRRYSSKVRLL